MFLSQAFGGRATDGQIVKQSQFVRNLIKFQASVTSVLEFEEAEVVS